VTDTLGTADLAARARAGDAAARDELARRHEGRIRLYVRGRLGRGLASRLDVDDLVQETYLRAFRDLDAFQPAGEGSFYRWLTALARHAVVDAARALRRRKRSAPVESLDLGEWSSLGPRAREIAAKTFGPATGAALAEAQRRMEEALLTLSPAHRRVLTLRQFEGRAAREVAGLLGSTEQAVHALYRRALAAWADAADVRAQEP
jgi:RNA polymerase sigma-70 factor (ECF subfamily)